MVIPMRPQILLDYFIVPALTHLAQVKPKIDSPAARQFMLAVAAQESRCGEYFKQLGDGPAQGIWQVEPATLHDLHINYLSYESQLDRHLFALLPMVDITDPMISCPLYNCGVARLCIYRQPCPMPELNDREGMFQVYKTYYNSVRGAATISEWRDNWKRYVESAKVSEL